MCSSRARHQIHLQQQQRKLQQDGGKHAVAETPKERAETQADGVERPRRREACRMLLASVVQHVL